MRVNLAALLLLLIVVSGNSVVAQSPNGSISGIVFDPDAKSIPGAEVIILNALTGVKQVASTNNEGIYAVPNLPPGTYRIQVSKAGFKSIIRPDITLNVEDALSVNFTLPIGAASVVVTVEGGAPMINTQSAAVSTVVDRQFAENLPMNGRSFQSLIQLTPGVVFTPSTSNDNGQFSVNGQRASSNYWMVDGVSANIGIGSGALYAGNGLGGTLGSFSALGGTNSLVSIDAMQEFRIQTSTFAPEFGRTPGGQISIVTRSGTNRLHGTAFDYLRNDVFDANNWFANQARLEKPKERQNDFGGTLGGPIVKDKTFFFFSYEGLRLRLPQTSLTSVPDLGARHDASPALQPYLNAFPFDPKELDLGGGAAQFNASYSNPASLDAYSLRIDHDLGGKVNLFGRYNYSPSEISLRGGGGDSLNTVSVNRINTQTATVGTTWMVSPALTNDLRFNYSRVNADSYDKLDSFGGAVPLASLPIPGQFSGQSSNFEFGIFSLTDGFILQGTNGRNIQRQMNVVDSLSKQKGSHSLKFGIDFRRSAPILQPFLYSQAPFFFDVPSAETGNLGIGIVEVSQVSEMTFHNLSFFGQDTWRVAPRVTVTYGLRWDVDFTPSSASGPRLAALTGYNPRNLAGLALASPGTAPFQTTYRNLAPRVGVAYQASQSSRWQSVVRGGVGIFYDLVDSEVGNATNVASYPFGATSIILGSGLGGSATFPFSSSEAAAPPVTPKAIYSFDPNLKLPYTLQWSFAFEQALGGQQTLTASYIGSVGKRLLQTALIDAPNASFRSVQVLGNTANSNYNALQIQFQRRLSRGLQTLASYTWSHSIDDASAGSLGSFSNSVVPSVNPEVNRGSSDFDIRNGFSAGLTYDLPAWKVGSFAKAIVHGWSIESVVQARSANPVSVFDSLSSTLLGASTQIRPNLVPGIPVYLYGPQYPGGKALNGTARQGGPGCKGPFCAPPAGQQGDLGRNALRGFGATQWDLAIHRDFPIGESFKLQFRSEMFNVLNHPNFGPPVGDITKSNFGLSTETLGQYLAGTNVAGGGFNALYETGGPRSIQLALKLIF